MLCTVLLLLGAYSIRRTTLPTLASRRLCMAHTRGVDRIPTDWLLWVPARNVAPVTLDSLMIQYSCPHTSAIVETNHYNTHTYIHSFAIAAQRATACRCISAWIVQALRQAIEYSQPHTLSRYINKLAHGPGNRYEYNISLMVSNDW